MESASKARAALRKALTFEQEHRERETKKSEEEIQKVLDKWRMRKKELKQLEEFMEVKEMVRTAKIAASGGRAAAEMLKYGVRYHLALPDCR
jgi:hypothetical protein